MKKVITLFMSILLVFFLVACGNQNSGNSSQTSQPTESTTLKSAPETSQQPSETPIEILAESPATPTEESSTENTAFTGSNILIAYFSVPEDVDTNGVDAVAGASVVVDDYPLYHPRWQWASRTVDTISQLQPGALMMGNELVLSRNDVAESEETVVTWAKELGIM